MSSAVVRHRPKGPLLHRCEHCFTIGPGLYRCKTCHLVMFCSPEHEAANFAIHAKTCLGVSTAVQAASANNNLLEDAKAIRTQVIFTNSWSQNPQLQWSFDATIARCTINLSEQFLRLALICIFEVSTAESVTEAVHILLTRVQSPLTGGNTLALTQGLIPVGFLLLGRDKECFEAMRKARFTIPGTHQPQPARQFWRDALGQDDDILQVPPFFDQVPLLLLLKLQLLVDIRNIKVARKLSAVWMLPQELKDMIKETLLQSSVSRARKFHQYSPEALLATELTLIRQVHDLVRVVGQRGDTRDCMTILLQIDAFYFATGRMPRGNPETDSHLIVNAIYRAYWAVEGAFDLLRGSRDCAAWWAEHGGDREAWWWHLDEDDRLLSPTSTSRQAQASVRDGRLADFLGSASANAAYLGRQLENGPEQRISERLITGGALQSETNLF